MVEGERDAHRERIQAHRQRKNRHGFDIHFCQQVLLLGVVIVVAECLAHHVGADEHEQPVGDPFGDGARSFREQARAIESDDEHDALEYSEIQSGDPRVHTPHVFDLHAFDGAHCEFVKRDADADEQVFHEFHGRLQAGFAYTRQPSDFTV